MKKTLLSLSLISIAFAAKAQSWVSQATGFDTASRGLTQIQIVDANTVWGLAFDGATTTNIVQEFTRTTDGGSNWTPGTIDVGDTNKEINSISAVNGQTAWVSALVGADGNGVIYKTSNGGATWTQQNASGYSTTGSSFLNGVYFFNANNGVAYGDPVGTEFEVYTTSNGGTTWTPVLVANIPNPASGEYGYNAIPTVAGGVLWFTTNKGKLYKTTDMGITWTKLNTPLTDFGATAVNGKVFFSDANNGYILGTSDSGTTYKLYKTTNGGTTWDAGTVYTGYRLMTCVPNTSILVACGAGTSSGGTGSAYSINGGTTWTSIDTGAQRLSPSFLNPTTGWCGGFSSDPFTGGVFKFSGALSVSNTTNPKSFKIYPNPAISSVTISSETAELENVIITDLTGKIIKQKTLNGVENNLDISDLSSGAYFFTVKGNSISETIKVMKN
ncbi:T9SS type A sorting domain-containing protein [Flavobacterium croceum]|uniref:T9SS type A sorting domain-containing protein n=1 Tax=Flavobacterium croceum TaxID=370975 RepID=UPI0024A983A9|nr:T9SS type A sorting domain-containing protein [Flavobacterium croceum]